MMQDVSDEQKSDFEALRAGSLEGGIPVTDTAGQGGQEAENLAGEIAGLVLVFVAMAKPVLPSLEKIYTAETTQAAAAAVAGLCRKYGWLQNGVAHGYGEEVTAAVILLPLAFATYKGVQADLRIQEKEPVTVPGEPLAVGHGSKTVQFGAPVPVTETAANDAAGGAYG